MQGLAKLMVIGAVIGFVLAVVGTLGASATIFGVHPEGYSRACSNLALIAIALMIGFKKQGA